MHDPFILSISIDGEPIAKGRPRTFMVGGKPRILTPKKTRLYEDRVRCEAVNAMGGREPVDEAVCVTVTAYRSIPKSMPKRLRQAALDGTLRPTTKPDADNNAKVLDALNGIIFRDDSLVTDLIVRKRYSERPRLTITVETGSDFA